MLHSQAAFLQCFISFIVSYSLVGYSALVLSTATNKLKWKSYRSELQRRKYMEQMHIASATGEKKHCNIWKGVHTA
jgi:hypothetical protein